MSNYGDATRRRQFARSRAIESGSQLHLAKMDKLKEMKKDAVTQLAILSEMNLEDSEPGVCAAIERVFHHGSYKDGAKAVMIASQWMWAHCEERYHSGDAK